MKLKSQFFNLVWPISVPGPLMQKLMHWANTELKEKAELAFVWQRYGRIMVPGVNFLSCNACYASPI
jgi:hypothetical protein